MKKWVVLLAGVISQTSLGGIYAWSTFVPFLMESYGFSAAKCGIIFGATIAVFSVATIPAGRFLLKHGPRLTATIGALLFISGYIVASFSQGSFPIILIGLGLISGIGIGFGYVCPLSVGIRWFPRNKGLVTGAAVAGFGMGAILLSSAAQLLLQTMDVLAVFRIVGSVFGSTALIAALFLSLPPNTRLESSASESSLQSFVLSAQFLLLCLAMFASTFAGLLISGNLKPLKLSLGLSETHATMTISLFAVGNAAGRLFWGIIHDRYKSRITILLGLGSLFLSILPLLIFTGAIQLLVVSIWIGFGFGACFVVYASSIVEFFGERNLPRLYPICFMAYGLAALTGPFAGGWMADLSGSYSNALIMSAGVVFLAFAAVLLGLPGPDQKVPKPTADKRRNLGTIPGVSIKRNVVLE